MYNYCRTCGFTDCPSLTEGGGCPRWPARELTEALGLDGCTCSPVRGSHKPSCAWSANPAPQPAGMFGPLTPLERETLAVKLQRAGHAFFESADAIGNTALYMQRTGRISAFSAEWDGLWAVRKPLADAMDEMHALTAEFDDISRKVRASA